MPLNLPGMRRGEKCVSKIHYDDLLFINTRKPSTTVSIKFVVEVNATATNGH